MYITARGSGGTCRPCLEVHRTRGFPPRSWHRRRRAVGLLAVLLLPSAGSARADRTGLRAGDPSVIRVRGACVSVQSAGGGVATSPARRPQVPADVPGRREGDPYAWENRHRYTGTFCCWGGTTCRRVDVPGPRSGTGRSIEFFEQGRRVGPAHDPLRAPGTSEVVHR
jgi:hypothetical protein